MQKKFFDVCEFNFLLGEQIRCGISRKKSNLHLIQRSRAKRGTYTISYRILYHNCARNSCHGLQRRQAELLSQKQLFIDY